MMFRILALLFLCSFNLQANQIIALPNGLSFACEVPKEYQQFPEQYANSMKQYLTTMVPGIKPMVDSGLTTWQDYFPGCSLMEDTPNDDEPVINTENQVTQNDQAGWLCPVNHPFYGQTDIIDMTATTAEGEQVLRAAGCALRNEISIDLVALSNSSAQWDCRLVKEKNQKILQNANDAKLYAISGCRLAEIKYEDWACPIESGINSKDDFAPLSLNDLQTQGCKEYKRISLENFDLSDPDAYWRCADGNYLSGRDDKRLAISDCRLISGEVARLEQKLASVDADFKDSQGNFVTFSTREWAFMPADLVKSYRAAKDKESKRIAAIEAEKAEQQALLDRAAEFQRQLENSCFVNVSRKLPFVNATLTAEDQKLIKVYRYEDSRETFWTSYLICKVQTEMENPSIYSLSNYISNNVDGFIVSARSVAIGEGTTEETMSIYEKRHFNNKDYAYEFNFKELIALPNQFSIANAPIVLLKNPNDQDVVVKDMLAKFRAGETLQGRKLISYFYLMGENKKAEEIIDLGASIGDYHAAVLKSYLLANQGKFDEAINLISKFTNYPSANLILGYMRYASGDYSKAFQNFVDVYEQHTSTDAREMIIRMLYLGEGIEQNQFAALLLATARYQQINNLSQNLDSVKYQAHGKTKQDAMIKIMNNFAFLPSLTHTNTTYDSPESGILTDIHFGIPYTHFYDINLKGQYDIERDNTWLDWRHDRIGANSLAVDYIYKTPNKVMPYFFNDWQRGYYDINDIYQLICLKGLTCEVSPLGVFYPKLAIPDCPENFNVADCRHLNLSERLEKFGGLKSILIEWAGRTIRFVDKVRALSLNQIKYDATESSQERFSYDFNISSTLNGIYDIDKLIQATTFNEVKKAGLDRESVMTLLRQVGGLENLENPLHPKNGVFLCSVVNQQGSAKQICGVYKHPERYFYKNTIQ